MCYITMRNDAKMNHFMKSSLAFMMKIKIKYQKSFRKKPYFSENPALAILNLK